MKRTHAPRAFEDGFCFFAFVTGESVEDDDVAGIESRGELGFDISFKGGAVHGAVDAGCAGVIRPPPTARPTRSTTASSVEAVWACSSGYLQHSQPRVASLSNR